MKLPPTANMSAMTIPPDGDHDRASELNTYAWTWFSISTLFIAARVYSRVKLTRNLWYDDYFIMVTWVRKFLKSLCVTLS